MDGKRKSLFAEINEERIRQDRQWGGPDHDVEHGFTDWAAFILRHLGKGLRAIGDPNQVRYRLIQVAALAIAAVEAHDLRGQAEDDDGDDDPVPYLPADVPASHEESEEVSYTMERFGVSSLEIWSDGLPESSQN